MRDRLDPGVRKVYASDLEALGGIDLDIRNGEILALLGSNGAGKTTLISTICGIARATAGRIEVDGHDVVTGFRRTRELIGLVPQEVHLDIFQTVFNAVRYSRGLFGKPRDDAYLKDLLKRLSFWES